ncbi:hypothetical protein [Streptomyces sp. NBC_00557]|nr:hypothetical protein [Streptomyces sp. NBC_00557]WUC32944.1 hypothetical protein OG956_01275 [Streptomyces sp. NBC_00557]
MHWLGGCSVGPCQGHARSGWYGFNAPVVDVPVRVAVPADE